MVIESSVSWRRDIFLLVLSAPCESKEGDARHPLSLFASRIEPSQHSADLPNRTAPKTKRWRDLSANYHPAHCALGHFQCSGQREFIEEGRLR